MGPKLAWNSAKYLATLAVGSWGNIMKATVKLAALMAWTAPAMAGLTVVTSQTEFATGASITQNTNWDGYAEGWTLVLTCSLTCSPETLPV